MQIRKGDTPETNTAAKHALEWIDEFTALLGGAVPAPSSRPGTRTARGREKTKAALEAGMKAAGVAQ
jgi:hypothetical protein